MILHLAEELQLNQQIVIFHNISLADSIALLNHPARQGRLTYFKTGLLFIKMPALPHEKAVTKTMDAFHGQIIGMGLADQIERIGSSTLQGQGGAAKEGDDGYVPRIEPRMYGDSFPTLAVECGNSESLAALRRDKD